ncbi:MAG: type II toxin-antitoxin system ParD family antitoxin [Planctomycetes bacterium]|nr:type II toxin-antitoxin system ParD family antitoxin [Planctomycetota bacterium]
MMTITLPESLSAWVNEQVEKGDYESPSDYVRRLIRQEQRRRVREQIEQNLLEALDSGPATPMTRKDWEDIRREGRRRAAARKNRK